LLRARRLSPLHSSYQFPRVSSRVAVHKFGCCDPCSVRGTVSAHGSSQSPRLCASAKPLADSPDCNPPKMTVGRARDINPPTIVRYQRRSHRRHGCVPCRIDTCVMNNLHFVHIVVATCKAH
jgi:hypothetical protein